MRAPTATSEAGRASSPRTTPCRSSRTPCAATTCAGWPSSATTSRAGAGAAAGRGRAARLAVGARRVVDDRPRPGRLAAAPGPPSLPRAALFARLPRRVRHGLPNMSDAPGHPAGATDDADRGGGRPSGSHRSGSSCWPRWCAWPWPPMLAFPTTEGSAYYVGVAANLVGGRAGQRRRLELRDATAGGPKPAFELWLPMSSLRLGRGHGAARSRLLGCPGRHRSAGRARGAALLGGGAPCRRHPGAGLDAGRAVALAAGLLACFAGPFVISAAMPDSYTPFMVFAMLAALLLPRALGAADDGRPVDGRPQASRAAGVASGMALGLAYLSRQEAIWLGLVVLILVAWSARRTATFVGRMRVIGASLWPIVLGGLLLVTPWLLRNMDPSAHPSRARPWRTSPAQQRGHLRLPGPTDAGGLPGPGARDRPGQPAAGGLRGPRRRDPPGRLPHRRGRAGRGGGPARRPGPQRA